MLLLDPLEQLDKTTAAPESKALAHLERCARTLREMREEQLGSSLLERRRARISSIAAPHELRSDDAHGLAELRWDSLQGLRRQAPCSREEVRREVVRVPDVSLHETHWLGLRRSGCLGSLALSGSGGP